MYVQVAELACLSINVACPIQYILEKEDSLIIDVHLLFLALGMFPDALISIFIFQYIISGVDWVNI